MSFEFSNNIAYKYTNVWQTQNQIYNIIFCEFTFFKIDYWFKFYKQRINTSKKKKIYTYSKSSDS